MRIRKLFAAAATAALAATVFAAPAEAATRFYFFQFNMAGNTMNEGGVGVAKAVVASVKDSKRWPYIVTLNEVCLNQHNYIRTRLDDHGYVGTWGPTGPKCKNGAAYGNAIFVKSGRTILGNFALPNPNNTEQRKILCVRSNRYDKWVACVTHISHKSADQKTQINAVATRVDSYRNGGNRVVVGGDFNVTPNSPWIDPMYASCYPGGKGRFYETDRAKCDGRGGEGTHSKGKIDYLFYSSHFYSFWGDATSSNYSDHDPLWGRAYLANP
ncbi:endonuclease/exonuclease/phosphatase family protein [Prauserella shujinwangii]|uniref:Endonuclease/exonuclease/phosphatase family protein n=1 Tax=Prauserella shujinwangii TaxID=1453103 RepID=A0A2T0LLL4_9PSEU|nr:endonuclease/exonuclease/phosphatase family protein [Prauserella shujinwangii]PRX43860.1 endonuclease/exonuclease/phosphatase family protein [Prauserella shujinwangii]